MATHEDDSPTPHPTGVELPAVPPRPYLQARMQPAVRPQWDPATLANKLLDDMEAGGRLHNLRHNKPKR